MTFIGCSTEQQKNGHVFQVYMGCLPRYKIFWVIKYLKIHLKGYKSYKVPSLIKWN